MPWLLLNIKKSVIISLVRRIYTSSSTWFYFHESLNEARNILNNNQYPPSLVEHVINDTLTKLLGVNEEVNDSVNESNNSECDLSLDSNACIRVVPNHEKFKFFVNYRGKPTEQLTKSFKKLNLPCNVIMTMRKVKTILPSLKPQIPRMLQSNVVYEIKCTGCNSSYVGQTTRHLQKRSKEHTGNGGPMKYHLEQCNVTLDENMIRILGKLLLFPDF